MEINIDRNPFGSQEEIDFSELELLEMSIEEKSDQISEKKNITEIDLNLDIEDFNIENITPKEGYFLGLDISKDSTGYCLIKEGKKITGNIQLTSIMKEIEDSEKFCYLEVLMRRALKEELLKLIEGLNFEVIVLEDAYAGENPKIVRLLYALNTAIDELLLDNFCTCKNFQRVSNRKWKSWLWRKCDPQNKLKGVTDKLRIQKCLEGIGVKEEGKGFQDRLDATGMIYGYLMCMYDEDTEKKKEDILWKDIGYDFVIGYTYLLKKHKNLSKLDRRYIETTKLTKKKIIEELNKTPKMLILFKDTVPGFLDLKLEVFKHNDGRGLFACWNKKYLRTK